MSGEVTKAEFADLFADLIDRFDASLFPSARPEFAGAETGNPLEHTTRVHFLDELVSLLGWSLGLGGDMAEEARLKGNTTTFMDYLGIETSANTPALLIEAKLWDKPFVQPRTNGPFETPALLGQGINHWRNGGGPERSPLAGEWHDHIKQVGGYVRGLRETYGHTLPRAVITSGRWMVVFLDPVQAFVDGPVEDVKIKIFHKQNYKAQAGEIFDLLSKKALATETPFSVRPTQVPDYLTSASLVACFHALHVSYEVSGTPVFGKKPRVLVYPALVLQGANDMLLTVLEETDEALLEYKKDEATDELSLGEHIATIAAGAVALLTRTAQVLQVELRPASIADFPGFPQESMHRTAVSRPLVRSNPRERDNWIIVTGQVAHFANSVPDVACRFHKWSACNAVHRAASPAAISKPMLSSPRALFVDESPHHCAHSDLLDGRRSRCQIHMIDASVCCRSCSFASVCWPGSSLTTLPCGT